jgi:hypothetical protein
MNMNINRPISAMKFCDAMTLGAYSRGHFTDSGWRQAIREFISRGFNDKQIIELMVSKHIRWAIDSAPRQKSRYTSTDILRYFDLSSPKEKFTPDDYDFMMKDIVLMSYRAC